MWRYVLYGQRHGEIVVLFNAQRGAARNDTAHQPMDSATVRRWVGDRVLVNPTDPNCTDCVYYNDWGVPWENLRAKTSDPRMAGFNRFNLFSKDGYVPGYNAQLVFQPELKLGLFTVMTTGPGPRVTSPFFNRHPHYSRLRRYSTDARLPQVAGPAAVAAALAG